ncbi:hypothetical protein KEH51_03405 [[Brevibacterium] frigoritolerans]|uniref:Uncharacterized protein n=1 Tax=Peribacillus frigoritolerans TaxID=450367 RepID=A0A941FFZ9_9BACI|nr:hypothetical protein [Peribacillus frigoritolerans]
MIGTEGTILLREKRVQGDPAGVPRRLPDRPRKASAWVKSTSKVTCSFVLFSPYPVTDFPLS